MVHSNVTTFEAESYDSAVGYSSQNSDVSIDNVPFSGSRFDLKTYLPVVSPPCRKL